MQETGLRNGAHGADKFGLKDLAAVHWNLPPEQLYEFAIAANEPEGVEAANVGLAYGVGWGLLTKTKFGPAFFK